MFDKKLYKMNKKESILFNEVNAGTYLGGPHHCHCARRRPLPNQLSASALVLVLVLEQTKSPDPPASYPPSSTRFVFDGQQQDKCD